MLKFVVLCTLFAFAFTQCTGTQVNVAFRLKSSAEGIYEHVEIRDSNEITKKKYDGCQNCDVTSTFCLDRGMYYAVLTHDQGSYWGTGAFLLISERAGGQDFLITSAKLIVNTEVIFPFQVGSFLDAMIGLSTQTWKMYTSTSDAPATSWKTYSFDASSWTDLTHSSRPSSSNTVYWFRKTFSVSSLTGFQGIDIYIKYKAGFIMYLNNNEVYRKNIASSVTEMTATTSPEAGAATATFKGFSFRIEKLSAGNNVIAIAVAELTHAAANQDFDCIIIPLRASPHMPRSFQQSAGTSTTANLVDMNFDTNWVVTHGGSPQSAIIEFTGDRAETINKYCISSSRTLATDTSDITAWKVSASNDGTAYTDLQTMDGIFFTTRGATYCFFMNGNTQAYHYYKLTATAGDAGKTKWSVNQWNLYLEDLTSVTVPNLSFSPSDLVGYVGADFPEVAANSPYYTQFTISPALPSYLTLNKVNGMIRGIPPTIMSQASYTITAKNQLEETKTTSVTLKVSTCDGDRIPFVLEFNMNTGAEQMYFRLVDNTTGLVVGQRNNLISMSTTSIPMCEAATLYTLVLGQNAGLGWGASTVTVKLADGSIILRESLAVGWVEKGYNVNVKYLIQPQTYEWNYLVTGAAPPKDWNKKGVKLSDNKAKAGSFPKATGVTSYYATELTLPDTKPFAVCDISVVTHAGLIMYFNGVEIGRYNLKPGVLDETIKAEKKNETPMKYTIGISVQFSEVVAGPGKFAFELHAFDEPEATNTFDASAILIMDNMYLLVGGVGTTDPVKTGNEGSDKVFDNNGDTKFYNGGKCVGIVMQWKWNDDRRETINNYGLVSTNDCNARHPSGWKFEGSNGGTTWTLLQTKTGQFFTSYKSQMRFDVATSTPFNMYKLTVTECNNPAITGDGSWCKNTDFQLADFYMFGKRISGLCERDGDFPPAMEGDSSTAPCFPDDLYTGVRKRTCMGGKFGEIVSECVAKTPSVFKYEKNDVDLILNKPITPITPTIYAADYTVTSTRLPPGLVLNNVTGVITGTPTEEKPRAQYSFWCENVGGRATTNVFITVAKAPVNTTLIVIIIVVVLVIIGIIVVVLILKGNKGKSGPKKSAKKSAPNKKTQKV